MATNISPANSPVVDFELLQSDDESWAFMGTPVAGSLSESSVAFLPSPASRSLASYGVVAHPGHRYRGPSPSLSSLSMSPGPFQVVPNSSPPPPTSAPSPVLLSAQSQRQPTSYPMQFTDVTSSSMNTTGLLTDDQFTMSPSHMSAEANGLMSPPNIYLLDQHYDTLVPNYLSAALQASALASDFASIEREHAQRQAQAQQQAARLDIPLQMQSAANVQPWNPMDVPEPHDPQMFMMDEYSSASPQGTFASINLASCQAASSRSAAISKMDSVSGAYEQQQQLQHQQLQHFQQFQIQQFCQQQRSPMRQQQQQQQQQKAQSQVQSSPLARTPIPNKATVSAGSFTKSGSSKLTTNNIDKVKGAGTRIEKRKATSSSSAAEKLQANASISVGNSFSSDDKFIIVTPTTISSHASSGSKHNLFEHLEALSATQKGRKGPLADEVKEGALQVRRLGACFCCHARKVRCDADRPCKNCTRLAVSVPQIVCWRFDDFLVELFPAVLRSHFRKEEMTAYVFTNIASFTRPCTVQLSSGLAFKSTLEIRGAKFFTAKSSDVLQHERLTLSGNQGHLKSFMAAPIALDMSETSDGSSSPQQERIKKVLRVYIESIIKEDSYVEQLTANLRQTDLPKKILTIIRNYYIQTNSPIVKQALVIYTMHYVMTHHISLTRDTVLKLAHTDLVPQNDMFVTPRMLNRQVKAILDEMMQEDVDKLFKMFTRELKPKSRGSWAPCLAAFLVFCLFMEAIGLALDFFAMSHNEYNIQHQHPQQPEFARSEAVKLGRAVENLPFRQFAYQFHNIYQTRQNAPNNPTTSAVSSTSASSPSSSSSQSSSYSSTSSSALKPAFNPLVDDRLLTSGDLDKPALQMVSSLRELLSGDSWSELDFLGSDYQLDIIEPHPYPRDVSFDYTGRLCSRFLLSFLDTEKIFPSC